jgi:hypothetical protein
MAAWGAGWQLPGRHNPAAEHRVSGQAGNELNPYACYLRFHQPLVSLKGITPGQLRSTTRSRRGLSGGGWSSATRSVDSPITLWASIVTLCMASFIDDRVPEREKDGFARMDA